MTFIAPPASPRFVVATSRPLAGSGRGRKAFGRIRSAEEDGARQALGVDPLWPMAELPGTAMEHLARIALS